MQSRRLKHALGETGKVSAFPAGERLNRKVRKGGAKIRKEFSFAFLCGIFAFFAVIFFPAVNSRELRLCRDTKHAPGGAENSRLGLYPKFSNAALELFMFEC